MTISTDFSMKPKSQTLFHFTKRLKTITEILKNGFWPKYSREDFNWYAHQSGDIYFPMVCFCDIPLSRIREHVESFGDYGIGVSKDWALENKLNPISYISEHSFYGKAVSNLYKEISSDKENKHYKDLIQHLLKMLSHYKPLKGKPTKSKNGQIKEYDQESEWRYVPQHDEICAWLNDDSVKIKADLEKFNRDTQKHCMLTISPKDIKYIIVKDDSEILKIATFIQSELGSFSSDDLTILLSRIISLERIRKDL